MLGLDNFNLRYILLGMILIGMSGGLLGTYAVLRKRSLLGDALAHSALPGVVIAFLITGSKDIVPLLIGATATGVVGVLVIQLIVNRTRIKPDAAIGMVLSVFFGIGIVFLTYAQQTAAGNQSGLDKFLFGQAAAIVPRDVQVMLVITVVIVAMLLLFYKEFKMMIFDYDYCRSIGFPAARIDLLLMALIVLTVMNGLQAVGVILIAAMLITPAAAARFWSDKLHIVLVLAMIAGILSGISGTYVSAAAPRIPTGPVMVLTATGIFTISAVVAPRKGLIARLVRQYNNRRRQHMQHILRAYYEIREQHAYPQKISITELANYLGVFERRLRPALRALQKKNWITLRDRNISLNEKGEEQALHIIKSHRLWEHYLLNRHILQKDHVHAPADNIEHILTVDIVARLEEILREQGVNVEKIIRPQTQEAAT